MNVVPGISVYNQDRLPPDQFVANFVARLDKLGSVLNVLRHIAAGGETEHQVLIGPRGMGKTTLLRRIAIAISEDKELSGHFIPLRFREEQYNVISLDAFWRNCGEALAEWCEDNGRGETADALDAAMDTEVWWDPEHAGDAFLDACAALDRRACLFLDNLDLILDGLAKDGWQLRNLLQRREGPVVIGAATQPLTRGADRNGPFYEFFHPDELPPLEEKELEDCMVALADRRGDPGQRVKEVLRKEPGRLKTLYRLTGGNPRVLTLIYLLFERTDTETIFQDLDSLLDQVTPFYKARIEEFSGFQQRAIIDAIALNWDPIGSAALHDATGVDVTTISSQIHKLRKEGFIEQVPTSSARDAYQISERFLNIWYLMRHGTRKTKQRLKWLTIFLTKLFSRDELGDLAARARDTKLCGSWHPDYRQAVIEAFDTMLAPQSLSERDGNSFLEPKSSGTSSSKPTPHQEAAAKLFSQAIEFFERRDYRSAANLYREIVASFEAPTDDMSESIIAAALGGEALSVRAAGDLEHALSLYNILLSRYLTSTNAFIQRNVAIALVGKAQALNELGRNEESLLVIDDIETRFTEYPDPHVATGVVEALVIKGIALGALGQPEDEIRAYDQAIAKARESNDTFVHRQIGTALINKAITLGEMSRFDEAEELYRSIEKTYVTSGDPDTRRHAARALLLLSKLYFDTDRQEESVDLLKSLVLQHAATDWLPIQRVVARGMFNLAFSLASLGREDEAVLAYDEQISRFEDNDDDEVLEAVARATVNRGALLIDSGKVDQAISVLNSFYDSNRDSINRSVVEQAFIAKINVGHALANKGSYDQAVEALTQGIETGLSAASDKFRVREAILRKGEVLQLGGRLNEALVAFEEAIDITEPISPDQEWIVAEAMLSRSDLLLELDRVEEGLGTVEALKTRFALNSSERIRGLVADASGRKGRILFHYLGRSFEAEASLRSALAGRPSLADAANLVWALLAQGKASEAEGQMALLDGIAPEGMALLRAALHFVQRNLGSGLNHLDAALQAEMNQRESAYFEDILWFLRIAVDAGDGEALIKWFISTSYAERYAPIFAALVARVQGERHLLDVNPEVRSTAKEFYKVLAATMKKEEPHDAAPRTKRGGKPRRRNEGTA